MPPLRHREEVINVKLADALASLGLDADAETIHLKGRPDVLVSLNGIKLVIEGRHHKSKVALLLDARTRIEKGIGEISLAVEYGDDLYVVPSSKLLESINESVFTGCVCYFASSKIQEHHFSRKSISELAELIRNAFMLIVKNDVVRDQVALVEDAINLAVNRATGTNLFFKSKNVTERLKKALAIDLTSKADGTDGKEED